MANWATWKNIDNSSEICTSKRRTESVSGAKAGTGARKYFKAFYLVSAAFEEAFGTISMESAVRRCIYIPCRVE